MRHEFATVNTDDYTLINNPGRCSGMSADWAKASLTFGSVRYPGMLSTGTADIAASAYMLFPSPNAGDDSKRAIEAVGLNVGLYSNRGAMTVPNVVATLVGLTGHYVWSLDFIGGGHFMGWRQDAGGGKIEFFDPNTGLYSFDSVVDVTANLPGLLAGYTPIVNFETWSVTK